jgi:tyrosinase
MEGEAAMLNNEFPSGSTIPLGTGGGCVVTGPFANTTVSLGPFPPQYITSGLPDNWTEPNPHCLSRDLNDWALDTFNNAARVDSLLAAPDIETFQFQLNPIHRGGHISVGGQLADFYVSPLEPTFFLHHAQIDRLWAVWQDEDEKRRYQYNGTSTFQNPIGVTPKVTGETVITFVPLGESISLDEVANPMGGRYCYRYV